jgi:hypothetical protein
MSNHEEPVTAPEDLVDTHREVAENALTDAIGIFIPGVSSAPESKPETDQIRTKRKRKRSGSLLILFMVITPMLENKVNAHKR